MDKIEKNIITSQDNNFYKLLKKLDKKKYRDEKNLFKIEGEKFFHEKINFSKIIIKESKYEYFNQKYNIHMYSNITILPDSLFDSVSTQENSQGVIFLFSKNIHTIDDIKGDVVILDDVQDPGNLGTIIRTMEAAGFKQLILTKGSVDVYNPKTVRATMGGIFNIDIIYETPENIINFLLKEEYQIIATCLSKHSIDYDEIVLKENRNAYIFGHEGSGISEQFLAIAHIHAIIPIYGNMESLNVSVAVGIFLYKMREKIENRNKC